jgi:hypothetical protein
MEPHGTVYDDGALLLREQKYRNRHPLYRLENRLLSDGASLQLLDSLLPLKPRLEEDDHLLRYRHTHSGARVACLPGSPPLDREDTKIAPLEAALVH